MSFPNPKNEKYTAWIFEATEDFQKALDQILGG